MEKKGISEVDFLNYIYKNAEMGVIGINDVIGKAKSEKFAKLLKAEKEEYLEICNEAENILKKYGKQNEENGMMAKMSSKMMSEMSLMKDDSDETIAKMMMEGSNKGVIAVTEKINAYDNKDAEIVVLANKLKATLEKNIDDLKKYL